MKRTLVIFAALLSLPFLTFAQKEKVSQAIEWAAWSNNIKIHKNLTILAEGQFRFAGQFEPMQFQFRTMADINLGKGFSVAPVGYVYTWNPTYGEQPNKFVNNEHRLYQQVQYKHRVGRAYFSHRGRLEQRFIQVHKVEGGEVVNEGYDLFLNRFRYRIMVNVPIGKKDLEAKTLFASFYSETFIDFGKKVVNHDPDQARVFVGGGYQFDKKLTISTGFLYQMLTKLNGHMQENNFGVQANITYNIDLTK